MTNVLVTGADGFIGSYVCKVLEADPDYNVTKVTSAVDLRDQASAVRISNDCNYDVVVHLAANVGVLKWTSLGDKMLADNVLIDANVAYAIRSMTSTPRVIYASTSEIYQDENQVEDAKISIPLTNDMRSGYALEKALGEKLFGDINLRIFNVVGPGQDDHFSLPMMISDARKGVIKASRDTRSFCSVHDAARWIKSIIDNITDVSPGVYNIGNPNNETTMLNVAKLINNLTGSTSRIEIVDDGYSRYRKPDITKASKYFKPEISLDEILAELIHN